MGSECALDPAGLGGLISIAEGVFFSAENVVGKDAFPATPV